MNGSLIIKNGSILTMDEAERARWLAVWGGKILDIGDGDGYEKYLSDDTVVIDVPKIIRSCRDSSIIISILS